MALHSFVLLLFIIMIGKSFLGMLTFEDDEDEEVVGGLYERGHWIWDHNTEALAFVSDTPAALDAVAITTRPPVETIQFRDDIDLLEQDVKDLAIFMAPTYILSPSLIHMLHLPTADRFFRTLIFYCQYYLQVAEQMSTRTEELEHKIRTPQCDAFEDEHRTNLSDLRILLGKEYSILLIELELNRIFKSEAFNSAKHQLKTDSLAKKTPEERSVLLGHCLKRDTKLTTRSPVLNEVFCPRIVDYRMFSIGIIKFPHLPDRLQYIWQTIAGPVEQFEALGISLGIIGMPRSHFDTMLHVIPKVLKEKNRSRGSIASTTSVKSVTRSNEPVPSLFPDIQLPAQSDTMPVPETFPGAAAATTPCSVVQRQRWQRRLRRLLHQSRSQSGRFQASESALPMSPSQGNLSVVASGH